MKYKQRKKVKSDFLHSEYNFEIYLNVIKLYILSDAWGWGCLHCFTISVVLSQGFFCGQVNNFCKVVLWIES